MERIVIVVGFFLAFGIAGSLDRLPNAITGTAYIFQPGEGAEKTMYEMVWGRDGKEILELPGQEEVVWGPIPYFEQIRATLFCPNGEVIYSAVGYYTGQSRFWPQEKCKKEDSKWILKKNWERLEATR